MKVAVILPSRGLIFSRTADEILQNVKGVPHKFFFSHRKPIPECFEKPVEAALSDNSITHVWIVEDDMILRPNTLMKLLDKDKAVVAADYPINKDGRGSIFEVDRQIVFCGTGCLLIKRDVFDELKKPYFRTDSRWNIKNFGDFIKMTEVDNGNLDGYGLHDINLCMALKKRKIPIHKINDKLGQRKLIKLGKQGTNKGAHLIEEWRTVKRNYLLKRVKSWPAEKHGDLVQVSTPTGIVNTTKSHADKLVEKGKGELTPRSKIVIEFKNESFDIVNHI